MNARLPPLYHGVDEKHRKYTRYSHFEVAGNLCQPMSNFYGSDCDLHNEMVPHLSKYLSYNAK